LQTRLAVDRGDIDTYSIM